MLQRALPALRVSEYFLRAFLIPLRNSRLWGREVLPLPRIATKAFLLRLLRPAVNLRRRADLSHRLLPKSIQGLFQRVFSYAKNQRRYLCLRFCKVYFAPGFQPDHCAGSSAARFARNFYWKRAVVLWLFLF